MNIPNATPSLANSGKFRGMMPILPTTITESGQLDLESQRNLVRYALACESVAIGHMGMASEAFKLTTTDRRTLIETALDEVAGRVPVFIGVTAPSTRVAVEYAREAEALGASLLMLAVPYVTVPDLPDARAYVKEVCRSVSVPVILQDTAASEQMFTPEVVIQLVSENANLRYFKADGRNFLPKTARLNELTGHSLEIIGGLGGKHMFQMLRQGVTSFMTGTEALDVHAAAVQAYNDGDHASSARIFYGEIMPYFAFYEVYPDELLKKMLHWRGLIACPAVIPPGVPVRMSEVEWKEFETILNRLDWKRDWGAILAPRASRVADTGLSLI